MVSCLVFPATDIALRHENCRNAHNKSSPHVGNILQAHRISPKSAAIFNARGFINGALQEKSIYSVDNRACCPKWEWVFPTSRSSKCLPLFVQLSVLFFLRWRRTRYYCHRACNSVQTCAIFLQFESISIRSCVYSIYQASCSGEIVKLFSSGWSHHADCHISSRGRFTYHISNVLAMGNILNYCPIGVAV